MYYERTSSHTDTYSWFRVCIACMQSMHTCDFSSYRTYIRITRAYNTVAAQGGFSVETAQEARVGDGGAGQRHGDQGQGRHADLHAHAWQNPRPFAGETPSQMCLSRAACVCFKPRSAWVFLFAHVRDEPTRVCLMFLCVLGRRLVCLRVSMYQHLAALVSTGSSMCSCPGCCSSVPQTTEEPR